MRSWMRSWWASLPALMMVAPASARLSSTLCWPLATYCSICARCWSQSVSDITRRLSSGLQSLQAFSMMKNSRCAWLMNSVSSNWGRGPYRGQPNGDGVDRGGAGRPDAEAGGHAHRPERRSGRRSPPEGMPGRPPADMRRHALNAERSRKMKKNGPPPKKSRESRPERARGRRRRSSRHRRSSRRRQKPPPPPPPPNPWPPPARASKAWWMSSCAVITGPPGVAGRRRWQRVAVDPLVGRSARSREGGGRRSLQQDRDGDGDDAEDERRGVGQVGLVAQAVVAEQRFHKGDADDQRQAHHQHDLLVAVVEGR